VPKSKALGKHIPTHPHRVTRATLIYEQALNSTTEEEYYRLNLVPVEEDEEEDLDQEGGVDYAVGHAGAQHHYLAHHLHQ
jgi:hypothetical protein